MVAVHSSAPLNALVVAWCCSDPDIPLSLAQGHLASSTSVHKTWVTRLEEEMFRQVWMDMVCFIHALISVGRMLTMVTQ